MSIHSSIMIAVTFLLQGFEPRKMTCVAEVMEEGIEVWWGEGETNVYKNQPTSNVEDKTKSKKQSPDVSWQQPRFWRNNSKISMTSVWTLMFDDCDGLSMYTTYTQHGIIVIRIVWKVAMSW